MSREKGIVLYPGNDLQIDTTCTEYLTSIHQTVHFPSADSFSIQSSENYCTVNSQHGYDPMNYFWRKYYSDLATEFSKSFHVYSTPFSGSFNYENGVSLERTLLSMVQPKGMTSDSAVGHRQYTNTSKNARIWRPFSPPPSQRNSSCFSESNSVGKKKNFMSGHRNIYRSIISPGVKLDHSKLSVFTPVKKKTFSCIRCSATFQSSLQMNTHMRMHTGSKPFTCDYPNCSKTFARNEELTRHRRIHSGYKPHLCGVCGKSFGRKDHLSKHLKTHLQVSEKKVYVCCVSGCGHRYTRSDALTRHKSTAHAIQKSQNTAHIIKERKDTNEQLICS